MAYNNAYPVTYPQMYYPQAYQAQPTLPVAQASQAQSQTNMIWVQGEAAAKSYLVAPNTTVQLWDSEAPTIYLKSADASGMPSIKVLDYTIRDGAKQVSPAASEGQMKQAASPDYATKDDLRALTEQMTLLRGRVDVLSKKRKERDDDDE